MEGSNNYATNIVQTTNFAAKEEENLVGRKYFRDGSNINF